MIVGRDPDIRTEALMRNRSTRNIRRGFTLVELLIVIIIIAVLAAVAIPKFASSSQRSKEGTLKSNLKIVRNAVEMFRADTGLTPATLADLAKATASAPTQAYNNAATPALVSIPAGTFRGPYIQEIPADPVTGGTLGYSVAAATLGKVTPNATGNDSNGDPFTGY